MTTYDFLFIKYNFSHLNVYKIYTKFYVFRLLNVYKAALIPYIITVDIILFVCLKKKEIKKKNWKTQRMC